MLHDTNIIAAPNPSEALLSAAAGAHVDADAPQPKKTSLLYQPGETLYGGVAQRALSKGWTLLPQERGERRITSKIDGRALKWGQYIDEAPPASEVGHWARQAPRANGAILLGKPSGLVFCFDIDVLETELSYAIQELAVRVLGRTRFTRQGQAPKMALFYRVEREEDLPRNRAYRFADSDDLFEIQARGKMITAYGYHHKTERYFIWRGPQPVTSDVLDVPLTTPEKIAEFVEAVQALRPFSQSASKSSRIIEGDGTLDVSAEGWTIPRVYNPDVVIDDAGLVGGGREGWLRSFCFDLVRLNPERASDSPAVAIEVALGVAAQRIVMTGRDVRGDVIDKIERAVAMLRRGEIRNLPIVREREDGTRETSQRGVLQGSGDPDLWHLPTTDKRKPVEIRSRTKADTAKAAERALQLDRSPIAGDVARQLDAGLGAFFDEVYSKQAMAKSVHVLKVPTGGGKTTRAASYIAHDPRTFADLEGEQTERSGPILFLLPTYNNIDELRARADVAALDPEADDEALAAQAAAAGIMTAEEAIAAIGELRAAAEGTGLKSMVYRGKIAAGCQFPEKVKALMDAGISTSGMCHAKIRGGDGQLEDKYCEHYATCPAIRQKSEIAAHHVVFLPHAFLNLSIPDELKNVRAVIADERIFPLVTHTAQMKLGTLELGRNSPHLTKEERADAFKGVVGWQKQNDALDAYGKRFLQDRSEAAAVAIAALRAGKCPAAALANFTLPGGKVSGLELVQNAARVCGAGISSNVQIFPGMPEQTFNDLVVRPTGTEIRLEYRFWKIIEERIKQLEAETHCQSREQRIQLRRETEVEGEEITTIELIRLSWRSELNWSSAPLLLLDASADEHITSKAFPDRRVVLHDIDAPLNLKTVLVVDRRRSTRSLTPAADIASQSAVAGARSIEQIQRVESTLAARHANGRMVVGMPKKVRSLIRKEYLPHANIDDLHYGAERGLNFAEKHVAALAIGRLEMPVWLLDGLAAALGYDDEDELTLLDPRGDGTDSDGDPLKPAVADLVVPMRDGSDVVIETPMAPAGSWQRRVQIQFREESIRQLAGRLRPVYRTDTPILYVLSQVLPEGIIVDDIVSTEDLIPLYAPLLEAARSVDGILDHVLAHAARPDIASKERLREMFKALPDALRAGYWCLRYLDGDIRRNVGVPAHFEDPIAVLEARLIDVGLRYSDIEIMREPVNARVAPAAARPADTIEDELGDRDTRRSAENAARMRAVEWLSQRHEADTRQPPYLPGRGRYVVGADADGRTLQLGLGAIALLTRPEKEDEAAKVVVPTTVADDEIPHKWSGNDELALAAM